MRVARIESDQAPTIDGSLDESVWQRPEWVGGFRQSVPDFGEPAREPTEVALLLDGHSLYVGVRCFDSAPELIRANKLRHRDEPDTDDHIELIFDTYRDEIRGTIFVVNPLGAKEEGLVNGYQRYNWDWDEVWHVRARITPDGWQAEMEIPLRVLRYPSGGDRVWGVNVVRVVRRLQEESYLSPPPPPYDISSLNFAAGLGGIRLEARQRNLQLIPYGLVGLTRSERGDDEDSDSFDEIGLDAKYAVTSDLMLNATFNTDFSQVEADDVQVNLTRFSLFYPEKREFFLENADLFSFGHGGGFGGGHAPEVTPFFSRRIGLFQGETVPIDGGLRLTGKVGREDLGVLSVRTGGVAELGLDPAWYNVARLRHDLGGRSYVGGIITDARIDGRSSTTFGVDSTWYITQDLSLLTDVMRVDDDESEATSAYYAGLDLTTDPWGFLFSFRQIDDGFDPEVGFVRRDGFRSGSGSLRRSIRPGAWGVRRVSFRLFGSVYDSLVKRATESSDVSLNTEFELETGDQIEVRFGRSFERLFEPFELDEELIFPAGDYDFAEWSVSYEADESRRWGVEADLSGGGFYDGDRLQAEGELWYVFNRHLRTGGSVARYEIDSPHGQVDWTLGGLRVDYTFSSFVSASAFVQYDSSSSLTILNLRLRWILPNDSDLFLVYDETELDPGGRPMQRDRQLALKVNYRFFL